MPAASKRLSVLSSALICLLLLSCDKQPKVISDFESILLRNINPESGGVEVRIDSDNDVIVRFVEKRADGLFEIRYKSSISHQERISLVETINNAGFFGLQSSSGDAPVAGEPSPFISIKSQAANGIVWRWDSERDQAFNALYLRLLEIAESAKQGKILYRGPYNPMSKLER
ncbi:MAG: hypothetical protein ACOC2L_04935 [Candidatus Sumerlaeota bacterium]